MKGISAKIILCFLLIQSILTKVAIVPYLIKEDMGMVAFYLVIITSAIIVFLFCSTVSYISIPKSVHRLRRILRFIALESIPCAIISLPFIALFAIFISIPALLLSPLEYLVQNPALTLISLATALALTILLSASFLAPAISITWNLGIRQSIKRSMSIYLENPLHTSATIVTTFLLFAAPSMLAISPFLVTTSPVLMISAGSDRVVIPLSVFFLSFGMAIGAALACRRLKEELEIYGEQSG